jgi:hypothetical protein
LSLLAASDDVVTPWLCWGWGIVVAIQVAADGICRDESSSRVVAEDQVQAALGSIPKTPSEDDANEA